MLHSPPPKRRKPLHSPHHPPPTLVHLPRDLPGTGTQQSQPHQPPQSSQAQCQQHTPSQQQPPPTQQTPPNSSTQEDNVGSKVVNLTIGIGPVSPKIIPKVEVGEDENSLPSKGDDTGERESEVDEPSHVKPQPYEDDNHQDHDHMKNSLSQDSKSLSNLPHLPSAVQTYVPYAPSGGSASSQLDNFPGPSGGL